MMFSRLGQSEDRVRGNLLFRVLLIKFGRDKYMRSRMICDVLDTDEPQPQERLAGCYCYHWFPACFIWPSASVCSVMFSSR